MYKKAILIYVRFENALMKDYFFGRKIFSSGKGKTSKLDQSTKLSLPKLEFERKNLTGVTDVAAVELKIKRRQLCHFIPSACGLRIDYRLFSMDL